MRLLVNENVLLCGGQLGDGDSAGGAAHVAEADLVAGHDRGRVAAVLAADAALEVGPYRLPAAMRWVSAQADCSGDNRIVGGPE